MAIKNIQEPSRTPGHTDRDTVVNSMQELAQLIASAPTPAIGKDA